MKLPSTWDSPDRALRPTRPSMMRGVALLLDGMSRAVILSFGPSLVYRLVYGGTLKLGLDCAKVAIPLALVAASYLVGKALGSNWARTVSVAAEVLPRRIARLSGIVIALLVFTFGAGLTSVSWLVLIRFCSGLLGGALCVWTDYPTASNELTKESKMESGLTVSPTSLAQKRNAYVGFASGTAKVYTTAFALSILAGGLLYRHAAGDATLRALTGVSLSPLFLIAVSLTWEWFLRCLFAHCDTGTQAQLDRYEPVHASQDASDLENDPVLPLVTRSTPSKFRQRLDSAGTDAFVGCRDRLDSVGSIPVSTSMIRDRAATADSAGSEFFDCNSVLSGMGDMDWFEEIDDAADPTSFVARYTNRQCLDGSGSPSYVPNGDSPDIIPQNYLKHCGDNREKALAMWQATQEWRRKNMVWRIHTMPNKWFHEIKQAYPHFLHGVSKQGYPIMYEQPGKMNLKQLFRGGCEVSDMLRHYMFLMEFISNCICTRDEVRDRMGPMAPIHSSSTWGILVVMDVKGAGLSHLSGDVLTYLKGAGDINNAHYPLSLKRAFVVKSPFWLAGVWKSVKGILPESVQVDILSPHQYLDALHEYIDDDQIPKEYGGSSPYPLGEHPFEVALRDLVKESDEGEDIDHTPGGWNAGTEEEVEESGAALLESKSWNSTKNSNTRRRRTDTHGDGTMQHIPLGDVHEDKKASYEPKKLASENDVWLVASSTHALWSCIQGMIETAIPFWILTPPELGGLGYEPSRSGVAMFSSALVLLWVMQTNVSKVISMMPGKTPIRSFRIGVGSQSVLLFLLCTVPRTVQPEGRSNAVLVMAVTIVFMSCIVLASLLGRASSTILHRLAATRMAEKEMVPHYWWVKYYGKNNFLQNCESGRMTSHIKFGSEIVGVLLTAPLGWLSLNPELPALLDGTFCLFLSSVVTLMLYALSFRFQLNTAGDLSTNKEGRNSWRTRRYCAILSRMAVVSLNDMASLLDETNSSLSPLLQQPNNSWDAEVSEV
eukprot:Nitzschia sp. Nitz4//scaffold2_size372955//258624//261620//NITZ4_000451-RA/size372955-processed-gene-0.50-mRNA-1//1//CDS//3329546862//4930//frame0